MSARRRWRKMKGRVAMRKMANGGTGRRIAAFFAGVLACAAGGASAATSYVVPWYVNPALKARVGAAGAAAFEPSDLNLSPKGGWLAFTAKDADGATSVHSLCLADVDELPEPDGVSTNAATGGVASELGLGANPLVLAADGHGAAIGVDRDAAALVALPNGARAYRSWTRRFVPKPGGAVSDPQSALASVRTMDLDAVEANVWSCNGVDGTLTRWTISSDSVPSLAWAETVDAGLKTVSSVALYEIGKDSPVECALVGEADATADTRGEVRIVNLATKAATALLIDAERLGAGIVSARMSHADYFRPRLYVLTAAGDVVCYHLSKDLSSATWTRTFANAELLSLAKAPFGAEAARVCAFEVSPDGGTAFIAYRRTSAASDAVADGVDAMSVAVLRHTPAQWRFYAAGEAGNPSVADEDCISDGQWALRYEKSGDGIRIGKGVQSASTSGNAYASAASAEYLDFSFGYVSNVSANTRLPIRAIAQWGLGTNALCRIPRVFLNSIKLTTYEQSKGWDGMEELVVDAPEVTWLSSWLGFYPSIERIVLNFPNVSGISAYSFSPNGGNCHGAETDSGEWAFPKLATVHFRALGWSNRKGCMDLPSAVVVSNGAFYASPRLEGARLAAAKRTLKFLGDSAFGGSKGVKKVVLGGVDGFHFGRDVFTQAPEEVAFTGGVPAFDTGSAYSFPDTAAQTMFFAVPRGYAAWEAALDGHVAPLSDAERRAVRAAHPDRPVPFGVVDASVFRTHHAQYVCYDDMRASCRVTIDHDEFFGDAVEVSADTEAGPDGAYLPGTTLTIAPRPSASGTFRKWYGDVPRADETNAVLTLVVTNDVWLFARFVHPWTLAEDRKTASNGNFTVNCYVLNEGERTLRVGVNSAFGLFADADEGEGVLDLGGEVRSSDGSEQWTFAQWGGGNCLFVRERNGKGNAHTLLSPGTIAGDWCWGQPFHATHSIIKPTGATVSRGDKSYRMVVLDEPAMTGSWGGWSTCGQTDLTRFILRTPKLSALAGDGAFWNVTMSETSFDWWDLSGVKRVAPRTLAVTWEYGAVDARGILRLPSVRNVENDGNWYSLGCMANAEGFEIGGATKDTTVTNVANYAFGRNASLRELTICNAPDMVVGTKPFDMGLTPQTITFTGPALLDDGTAFANLTAGVSAAAVKPVVVYASALRGWADVPYLDRDVTAEERAQAPGERVIGVYRGGAAAPLGKALVVHRRSAFDGEATLLLFR